MTNGDNIQLGPLANKTRTEARKIAVFNLTTTKYKNGGENNYEDLSQIKSGVFVKYPSQAGVFFQWTSNAHPRRAYHPTKPVNGYSSTDDWDDIFVGARPMWDNGTGTDYAWNHKDISEVCPPGYHRPNDGYTNQIAYNGPYPNFERTLPLPVERSTHDGDPASNSND